MDPLTFEGVQILFCDNKILVAVKPINMPSQRDASGDLDMLTVMKQYVKQAYSKPGDAFLGLLHRLDRPVGGVMVFARNSKAAAKMSAAFRERTVEKQYLAVLTGDAPETAEWCDALPEEATLSLRCLSRQNGLSLVVIDLGTGRKHQIRKQCALRGFPIWGDNRHGNGIPGQQIALWCARLGFVHPGTLQKLIFEAPCPAAIPFTNFREREATLPR